MIAGGPRYDGPSLVIPDDPGSQRRLVLAAAFFTVALGLVFVFVRAPHPFGWAGIDHYDDLARGLARGEPFPTTDVPWGYAYFLSMSYRLAGDRPWVPLVAQVLLNGLVPLFLYRLVRESFSARAAVTAALLVSVLSFNTVYASTQTSDSVCTVLFLASTMIFVSAVHRDRPGLFAASGLLAGLASQFRPNLVLFPAVMAAVAFVRLERSARRAIALAIYVMLAASVAVPWIVRNYRLTGELIPTSTHGGIQLWYGSLQTGPYLQSRAYNPRSLFEAPPFDYTSLAGRTIVISTSRPCDGSTGTDLFYWTDRDRQPRQAPPAGATPHGLTFVAPGQPVGTVLYYYLATADRRGRPVFTPPGGANDPFVYFVDDRHLADLDRHGDLLDAFDLIRAVRTTAFGTTGQPPDVHAIARTLLANERAIPADADPVTAITVDGDRATLRLADGSSFAVPRDWSGLITDVMATPGLAGRLCYTRVRTRSLGHAAEPPGECRPLGQVRANDVFYRHEPHAMRRYTALAWDNIRRAPVPFLLSSVYRAGRLFVIAGSSDAQTTWQFRGSGIVYALATAASLAYLLAAAAGVVMALRRGYPLWPLLTPIVYIPATICFVLTNMRYTITVQPLLIAFIAVALTAPAPGAALSETRTRSPLS